MNPGQTCGTNTVQKGVWKELEPLSQLIPILTWNIWNDIFILYDIALYILHYSTVYSVCLMHWIHSIHCFFSPEKTCWFCQSLVWPWSAISSPRTSAGWARCSLACPAETSTERRDTTWHDVTRRDTTWHDMTLDSERSKKIESRRDTPNLEPKRIEKLILGQIFQGERYCAIFIHCYRSYDNFQANRALTNRRTISTPHIYFITAVSEWLNENSCHIAGSNSYSSLIPLSFHLPLQLQQTSPRAQLCQRVAGSAQKSGTVAIFVIFVIFAIFLGNGYQQKTTTHKP